MSNWNPVTEMLRKDLTKLTDELEKLIFLPKMKADILSFMEKNPDVTERTMRKVMNPMNLYLLYLSFYHAWAELQKEKAIVFQSHGHGKLRTWRINQK